MAEQVWAQGRRERRTAILFPDGSASVYPAGTQPTAEMVRDELEDANQNETDPAHFSRVAVVMFSIREILPALTDKERRRSLYRQLRDEFKDEPA